MKRPGNVMNAKEAAQFLGAHVETIRRLARKGEVPAYKVGKDWRFRREALVEWMDGHPVRQKLPNILIVDEEEPIRNLVELFLSKEGFKVFKAGDGAEGLFLLEDAPIDLILLDLQMPGMSGPQFLLQARKRGIDLPVILITGYPDSDLVLEAMKFGPVTLLVKPLTRAMLLRAVNAGINGAYKASTRPEGAL